MNLFRIEMLPAEEGDALWIEYGDPGKPRRMLIDAGVFGTYDAVKARIDAIDGRRRIELMVVTHIDNDHIDAMVKLLGGDLGIQVGDFWFNAWDQIREDTLGAKQGEMLSDRIAEQGFRHNRKTKGGPIGIPSDEHERLPAFALPGGMRITVLGPTRADLTALRKAWKQTIEDAGLEPGGEFTGAKLAQESPKYQKDRLGSRPPNLERWANRAFAEDGSKPNASSISFLAEYGNRRVLFTGDARSNSLVEGLDRLIEERALQKLEIDALKVPHHGSKHNVSNELMQRLDCRHFLISSSGNRFHHPDDDAVARLIFHSDHPTLHFNYRSSDNEDWDRPNWKSELGYEAVYPPAGQPGLVVEFEVDEGSI
ncbi:MAG: hypothetical protein P1T08_16275 [Acidimicrobiia bacterium]|nr:hypothetical protein [Acidimicrobiia bacterium]